MGIEYFLQQLVNGICLGGMYALMSVGYSLVYSIMKFCTHGAERSVSSGISALRRGQRPARRHHRAAGLLAAA